MTLSATVPPHRAAADDPSDPDGAARLDLLLDLSGAPGAPGAPGPGGVAHPAPCRARVHAAGELEATTAHLLLREVDTAAARGCTHLVLDLRDVTFCDVRGVGAVLAARTRLRAAGGDLRLCGVRPFLREVLAAMRLDDVLAG